MSDVSRYMASFDAILANNQSIRRKNKKSLVSGRVVKLVCVTTDNHNKFYNMIEDPNGSTFTVEYGRIGTDPKTTSYPISKWDSQYRQKIAKGYKDVTDNYKIPDASTTGSSLVSSKSPFTDIIRKLQEFAGQVVKQNYTISTASVTQKMIKEAQAVLDELARRVGDTQNSPFHGRSQVGKLTPVAWVDEFNKNLTDLFRILPRKMGKVNRFLADLNDLTSDPKAVDTKLNDIIKREQDILDALSGTITTATIKSGATNKDDTQELLDRLGIVFKAKDPSLEAEVKSMLGNLAGRYVNCWYVTNNTTQSAYDANMGSAPSKVHKKEMILWHGSRNENWLSIVSTGLKIRPAGVQTTGSMFGNGIYFADLAKKSFGYTSGRGSYWARGSSNTAFLALFKVRVGKQKTLSKSPSDNYNYSLSYIQQMGGFDSVFGKAGQSLLNNEYIVYDPAQCTIYALVELES